MNTWTCFDFWWGTRELALSRTLIFSKKVTLNGFLFIGWCRVRQKVRRTALLVMKNVSGLGCVFCITVVTSRLIMIMIEGMTLW
jgi:hypothetical protein